MLIVRVVYEDVLQQNVQRSPNARHIELFI
jgi:hypothetical protein